MTSRMKTPKPAPQIHAPGAHYQEPKIEARLNPAGLTIYFSELAQRVWRCACFAVAPGITGAPELDS